MSEQEMGGVSQAVTAYLFPFSDTVDGLKCLDFLSSLLPSFLLFLYFFLPFSPLTYTMKAPKDILLLL